MMWSNHLDESRPMVLDLSKAAKEILLRKSDETGINARSSGTPGESAAAADAPKDGGLVQKSSGEHEKEQPFIGDEQKNSSPNA